MAIALVRTLIVYFTIIVSMRIMGKRQIGELAPSELVVAVLISELAANPLQDTATPLLYGIIPTITLLCCEILLSSLINANVKFRALLCGKPSMIIENGIINQKEMWKNRYTPDELQESLRQKGVIDISTVMNAVLETNGTLSVILKDEHAPLTPTEAGIKVKPTGYPITIVSEGRLLSENLNYLGRDAKWLKSVYKKFGVKSADELYLLTADSGNNLYCVKRDEK